MRSAADAETTVQNSSLYSSFFRFIDKYLAGTYPCGTQLAPLYRTFADVVSFGFQRQSEKCKMFPKIHPGVTPANLLMIAGSQSFSSHTQVVRLGLYNLIRCSWPIDLFCSSLSSQASYLESTQLHKVSDPGSWFKTWASSRNIYCTWLSSSYIPVRSVILNKGKKILIGCILRNVNCSYRVRKFFGLNLLLSSFVIFSMKNYLANYNISAHITVCFYLSEIRVGTGWVKENKQMT